MTLDPTTLPEPKFVDTEFTAILNRNELAYEAVSGTTLPQESVARYNGSAASYLEQFNRIEINETGKQNLIAFSGGNNLDNVVAMLGMTRLTSTYSVCTIQFTFPSAMVSDYSIPAGRSIQTSDGSYTFVTDSILIIATGDTTGSVTATCTVAGTAPNDLAVGVVSDLQDTMAVEPSTVSNSDITNGGGAVETDEQLQQRFLFASVIPSTAGSREAYQYYARTASTTIADVSVEVLNPGQVQICTLLVDGGIPNAALLLAVFNACDDETIRPLTDTITSIAPTAVSFNISVTFDYYKDSSSIVSDIQEQFESDLEQWANIKKEKLGADLVPDEIIRIGMNIAGVYQVNITTPVYQVISRTEFPNIGTITVTTGAEYVG